MARQLLIEYKGVFYHTTSRGNERRRICFTKSDYGRFKEKGRRYHCQFVLTQGLTPFFSGGRIQGLRMTPIHKLSLEPTLMDSTVLGSLKILLRADIAHSLFLNVLCLCTQDKIVLPNNPL